MCMMLERVAWGEKLRNEAGWAIQLREHPGDHTWWHIEVPVGVPSVSTQCPGQALGSPLQRPSRGRAATCLHEKTRLVSGHGSFSSGTYDAQTSCIPLKRYKMAYLWRRAWEAPPVRPVHILLHHRPQHPLGFSPCSHWRQSRTPGSLTLVFVTTKHKSLHWACNRHLPMVGLRTWWFLSSSSEFIPLATVEWKEFLPGSSLSHLGPRSRNNDLSYFSGACIVATT